MAKKKSITSEKLISMYMEYALEHNNHPESIYKFAKLNNFEEAAFYGYFANFDELEKTIFKVFFHKTLELLEQNKDYSNFDSRNKLLSFHFTFFELLTANRSYVIYALNKNLSPLKSLQTLSMLKKVYTDYVDKLNFNLPEIKQERLSKVQSKSLKESAWIQLLLTMKFWMDDSSPNFEKTDIFIEKSINASLDLIDIRPLSSIIDFGKFLFKEKVQMN
ncbi:TetR family transcriptional regulator C-terminal domain-containing protein [Winogradskyella sp. 3972H.M.0a.05]|uniref:TetR family transcriptional regulator C-terminal domain-containing protein n=1 Tax=Winogradskyella sp. 3972H.M.0a.05 TaxID=2950277 RepID=UPI00339A2675